MFLVINKDQSNWSKAVVNTYPVTSFVIVCCIIVSNVIYRLLCNSY